ncbi:hypothetical protein Pcinc_044164 [Petrolisthes cinctipes]|uniref:Arrestin C-terminal-like domain-containing protein n=1 Tax=Petrolisthes cinctipes TaxID=88211 RepID=A0AAE1BE74_PETCI|nr:hypothetical protein Pcinc_044164 [Petrolisthes cinctipes]
MVGQDKRALCCLCCKRGPVSLRTQLERTAYVCGESIKLKADIDNQSEEEIRLRLKLVQYVEYFIDRGVLGVSKDVQHPVLEYTGDPVAVGTRWKFDSSQSLVVPVMPPTLIGVCRLLQIYYVLKVNIVMSKSGEDLHMHFPITVATVPFRIPNSTHQPNITYSQCCDHVEGGQYIGPEFQLGQVYDGGLECSPESVLLYRPVYACIPKPKLSTTPAAHDVEKEHKWKDKKNSNSMNDSKQHPTLETQYPMTTTTKTKKFHNDLLQHLNSKLIKNTVANDINKDQGIPQ